ncbi:hypothetical protein Syun_016819 [Stephania yunnanensis]|uniref:Uncharacterized protein n=1 Tax=Stephania yunnanensis TaxID=152371 RepID=A0AAP0J5G8_9MAGN
MIIESHLKRHPQEMEQGAGWLEKVFWSVRLSSWRKTARNGLFIHSDRTQKDTPRYMLVLGDFSLLQSTCHSVIRWFPVESTCHAQIHPRVPEKLSHLLHATWQFSICPLASAADACTCKSCKGSCSTNEHTTHGGAHPASSPASSPPITTRHVTQASKINQSDVDTWQRMETNSSQPFDRPRRTYHKQNLILGSFKRVFSESGRGVNYYFFSLLGGLFFLFLFLFHKPLFYTLFLDF